MVDIEDLVSLGEKKLFCPYFLMKDKIVASRSNISLVPYQYILNDKQCRFIFKNKKKGIIIFDEAHNISRDAEQTMAADFSTADLEQMIQDCKAIKLIIFNNKDKSLESSFKSHLENIK